MITLSTTELPSLYLEVYPLKKIKGVRRKKPPIGITVVKKSNYGHFFT